MFEVYKLVFVVYKDLDPLPLWCFVAVILTCYAFVSIVLFFKPLLLHEQKISFPRCFHISHRGGKQLQFCRKNPKFFTFQFTLTSEISIIFH